ncbi:MAG: ABC transporter ATP-binding protein [Alphaproteobacteria bacterium]|nr:ABC transporter ATP-binding protein/permease [Alphaproteobacteria bacterium]
MTASPLLNDVGTKRHVKRLLTVYAKPHIKRLLVSFAAMLVLSLASIGPAKLIENVVNDIFIAKDAAMLLPVTLLIVAAFFLKGGAHYVSSVCLDYVGQRIVANIQHDLFKALIKADLSFFHNVPSGELVSRFTNDVDKLRNAVTGTLSSLFKDTLTFIFFVILMFYQDFTLAMIAFFVLPAAILPVARIGKRIRKTSTNIQEETASLVILLTQAFQGIRLIKSYCMEAYEASRIQGIVEAIFKKVYKASRIRSATHPIMEFLGGLATAIIIFYGGNQVIEGTQTPGAFFSFIAALLLVYEPLKRLAALNGNLQEQLGAASRVFAVLDYAPLITSPKTPLTHTALKGHLTFDQVSFAYDGRFETLSDITLQVSPGQKVAFVGSSGAGKSTLINLIPRFYDVLKGRVLIDGLDVRDFALHDLRTQIALVSQEVTLFDDTIRANIAYGSEGATFEEIQKAAMGAAAHDFITALPQGYDTLVGEQGVKLSGGQRQRLSIARALLKNAPVLLLDEPTSALDSESERLVQQALDELMHARTTLVIAHRLATVKDADTIYVMDQGRIVAFGTHDELLTNSPLYKHLCASQLSHDKASPTSKDDDEPVH